MSHEKVHTLSDVLSEAFKKVSKQTTHEKVWIDKELFLSDVNVNTLREIEVLAPFGYGNPKPVFLFSSVVVVGVKKFGKKNEHLEVVFRENDKEVKAVTFFKKPEDFGNVPLVGKKINLVATMEKSMFRNFPELRLRIVDIV